MEIRKLQSEDFEDWKPLWLGYLDFYRSRLAEPMHDLTFKRLTEGGKPMGGLIARAQTGAALGVAHWIDHPSCWTEGDYCYLQDLFVVESARGAGVGTALIDAVEAAARRRNCARLYWLTHETNANARKLYDKIAQPSGFIQYVRKFA